jgi:hypothetical protein
MRVRTFLFVCGNELEKNPKIPGGQSGDSIWRKNIKEDDKKGGNVNERMKEDVK